MDIDMDVDVEILELNYPRLKKIMEWCHCYLNKETILLTVYGC